MPENLKPVDTIAELDWLAQTDGGYCELAKRAARNLGARTGLNGADSIAYLKTEATETSEEGVVAEINFVI